MRIAMIILSLLWLWFGVHICKKNFCAAATPATTESSTGLLGATGGDCNSTLMLVDKSGDLNISSAENFQFIKSSGDMLPTTSDMAGVITQLKTHLDDNPDRFMQITGLYHETEENKTNLENLGAARAASVRSFLLSKGIAAAQLTMADQIDNELCTTDKKILKGVSVAFNKMN